MSITLYHLTPAYNLDSIRQNGIRPSKDGYAYFSLNKFDTIFYAPWGGEILFCNGAERAPKLIILGVHFSKENLLKTQIIHRKIVDLDGTHRISAEILYPGVVHFTDDMEVYEISPDEMQRRYRNSEFL